MILDCRSPTINNYVKFKYVPRCKCMLHYRLDVMETIDLSDISDESENFETALEVWHRLFAQEADLESSSKQDVELTKQPEPLKARRRPRQRKPSIEIDSSESELSQGDSPTERSKATKQRRPARKKPQTRQRKKVAPVEKGPTVTEVVNRRTEPSARKTVRKATACKNNRRSARIRTRVAFLESSQSMEFAKSPVPSTESPPHPRHVDTKADLEGSSSTTETLLDTPPFAPDDTPILESPQTSLREEKHAASDQKSTSRTKEIEQSTELDELFFESNNSPSRKPPPRKSKRLVKTSIYCRAWA